MVTVEILVWVVAITMNALTLYFDASVYEKTALLRVLREILTTPFPMWLIIVLCGIGTFVSIIFADDVVDQMTHPSSTV